MKFGVDLDILPNLKENVRQIEECEKLGFDSVWFPDHLLFTRMDATAPDIWSILTVAGGTTSRITLGSAVSDPHRIHPAVFAQRLATINHLVGERVILGLGAGEAMNLDPFGVRWSMPVSRMVEAVEVMRRLWESDPKNPVNYDGKFFKLRNAYLQIKPRGRIPIYIGANSPKTRKITGEVGDGWLPAYLPAKTYESYLKEVREASKRKVEACLLVFASIDENADLALNALKPIKYIIAWPFELEKMGYKVPEEFRDLSYPKLLPTDFETIKRMREFNKHVPDEAVFEFAICGDQKVFSKRVEDYAKVGVEHLVLQNFSPDPKKALKMMSEVIPSFK